MHLKLKRLFPSGRDALNEERPASLGEVEGSPVANPPNKNPALERDISNGLDVIRKLLASSDEQIRSREFVLSCLLQFGISYNDWPLLSRYTNYINSSLFGVLQIPTEFTDFILEISKHEISTAIEVGVFRGGSSYFIAAVLQRINPNVRYTMVDIEDHLIAYDQFSALLNLERRIPATSTDFAGQSFDLAFLDADHSYDSTKADFINVGRHARKLCAFHDIHGHEYDHLNGGVVRCWNEVRDALAPTNRIVEFAHNPARWMGIGLVEMNS